MFQKIAYLGLLGMASAATVPRQSSSPSSSKAFNLVLHLEDPAADFDTPVQNNFITSIHTGAGLALIGVSPDEGRIFYQNGTQEDYNVGRSTVVTDGGTPPFPSGITLVADASGYTTANLNAGPGTPGVKISGGDGPSLLPETFLACNEPLDYYNGKEFVIIKQSIAEEIPEQCCKVRLVPQCAELNELPDGSTSSHEFVLDAPCYEKA